MDIDHRQLVGRHLNRFAVVMRLDELAPVGRWAPARRDWWWLERFAEVCQNLPDRPWLCDERNQPDVAAAVRALERKLLPHPGHEFRPSNPGGVVRAGCLMRVRAASRGVTVAPMPTGSGVAPLADVADRQRRDGFSQLVIRREHPVVVMPVLPRRRHEGSEPVEELKNGESSTTPLAPGRVDFRPRPGPTQLAALCRGST